MHPQLGKLCEVYESYCNGIKPAFQLLKELKSGVQFKSFLKVSSCCEPSLLITSTVVPLSVAILNSQATLSN